MRVYTSYFSKIEELEFHGIVPVAICARCPDWYHGETAKGLAPSFMCLKNYHKYHDEVVYASQYYNETLRHLLPEGILGALRLLSGGRDVALICYEKPSDFCHRHIVAKWLTESGIVNVEEWRAPESEVKS